MEPFPNSFILGAPKAGTTSLAKILSAHPEIFVPGIKEPAFFSNDELFEKGYKAYAEIYAGVTREKSVFDATPQYFCVEKVASRLREYQDYLGLDLKFVVILRNPIEASWSWYCHLVRDGKESEAFDAVLDKEQERISSGQKRRGEIEYSYVHAWRYGGHLQRYFSNFERHQFRIYEYKKFWSEIDQSVNDLQEFLGVVPRKLKTDVHANVRGRHRFRVVQHMLHRDSMLKTIAKTVLSQNSRSSLKQKMHDWSVVPDRAEIPPDAKDRLKRLLEDDVKTVRKMTRGSVGEEWLI